MLYLPFQPCSSLFFSLRFFYCSIRPDCLKELSVHLDFKRWDILNQFMDIFQGWYKDGTNGTRDYRYFFAFYFLLRIGLLCEFVVLFLVNYNWKYMLTLKYSCTGVAHVLLGVLRTLHHSTVQDELDESSRWIDSHNSWNPLVTLHFQIQRCWYISFSLWTSSIHIYGYIS